MKSERERKALGQINVSVAQQLEIFRDLVVAERDGVSFTVGIDDENVAEYDVYQLSVIEQIAVGQGTVVFSFFVYHHIDIWKNAGHFENAFNKFLKFLIAITEFYYLRLLFRFYQDTSYH